MKITKAIGTHSGCFHADEVVATTLLVNFTKTYKDAIITRTRDANLLKEMDVIVDVGGEYNPIRNRYDHHQKGFTETYSDKYETKLSSAGLIFKHFGKEIVENSIDDLFNNSRLIDNKYYFKLSEDHISSFTERLYKDFFECIDAVDNGISQYPIETKPKYKSHSNDLIARIGRLNWNDYSQTSITSDEMFKEAMKLAKEEFLIEVRFIYCDEFIAFPFVRKAIENRKNVHSSERIIYLENSCSWKTALFKIEEELDIKGHIMFIIYKEKQDGTFRVQAVPKMLGTFELRKSLKDEFKGLRDEQLSKISGVSNCVFCHISGFIGGTKEYDEAVQLAVLSL